MKISTKGRYGIRLMTELGLNYNKNVMPLKKIATNQDISEKYLEQIINQLNKSGLVKSIRGSQGGYTLAYPPQEITVGQVLRVLEGSLTPVSCLEYDGDGCERAKLCAALDIWKEINTVVNEIVDKYTIADLVVKHNEKLGKL